MSMHYEKFVAVNTVYIFNFHILGFCMSRNYWIYNLKEAQIYELVKL